MKTNDPNVFGEALRNYIFVKTNENDLGCYSTFEVARGFDEVKDTTLQMQICSYLCCPEDITPIMLKNGNLIVAWFWDGDGVLLVGEDNHWAINTDCKKDYRWEWCR